MVVFEATSWEISFPFPIAEEEAIDEMDEESGKDIERRVKSEMRGEVFLSARERGFEKFQEK